MGQQRSRSSQSPAELTKMMVPARRRLVVKSRIRLWLIEPRTASMTMRTTMKEAPLGKGEREVSSPIIAELPLQTHMANPPLTLRLK